MTWARFDDGFYEHPKILRLSDSAFRLHVTAIIYSARNLTDGLVVREVLPRLGARGRSLNALVDAGLWDQDDEGYRIHDFLEYNPSREESGAKRTARAEAGRIGGQRSGETRRSKREAKPKQMLEAKTNPVPSRPLDPSDLREPNGSLRETPVSLPKKTVVTEEWLAEEREFFGERIRDFNGAVAFAMNSTYFAKKPDKRAYVHGQLEAQAKRDAERNTNGRPNTHQRSAGPNRSPSRDEFAAAWSARAAQR